MKYYVLLCCLMLLVYGICACWWAATCCWYPTGMSFHFVHPSSGRQAHSRNFKALSDVGACRNGGWTFRMPGAWVECWRLDEIHFHCVNSISIVHFWHEYTRCLQYSNGWRVDCLIRVSFFGLMYGLTQCDIFHLWWEINSSNWSTTNGMNPKSHTSVLILWFLLKEKPEVLMKQDENNPQKTSWHVRCTDAAVLKVRFASVLIVVSAYFLLALDGLTLLHQQKKLIPKSFEVSLALNCFNRVSRAKICRSTIDRSECT